MSAVSIAQSSSWLSWEFPKPISIHAPLAKSKNCPPNQVKDLVNQNPELSDTDKAKTLKRIGVIVLAQNRRVDITLSTTGQQSVQLYPFNAADAMTLLSEKLRRPEGSRKEESEVEQNQGGRICAPLSADVPEC